MSEKGAKPPSRPAQLGQAAKELTLAADEIGIRDGDPGMALFRGIERVCSALDEAHEQIMVKLRVDATGMLRAAAGAAFRTAAQDWLRHLRWQVAGVAALIAVVALGLGAAIGFYCGHSSFEERLAMDCLKAARPYQDGTVCTIWINPPGRR